MEDARHLGHHQQRLRLPLHDLRDFLERVATHYAGHGKHDELLGCSDGWSSDLECSVVLGASEEGISWSNC